MAASATRSSTNRAVSAAQDSAQAAENLEAQSGKLCDAVDSFLETVRRDAA